MSTKGVSVGGTIASARRALGWSQACLAEAAAAGDKAFISRVETGAVDRVVDAMLDPLCRKMLAALEAGDDAAFETCSDALRALRKVAT
jgi:predicted transcriptional regulator